MVEHSSHRKFENLDKKDRLRAVIANSDTPILDTFAFEISEIDLDKLSPNELEEVNSIFTEEGIHKLTPEEISKLSRENLTGNWYVMNETRREEIWQEIDRESVEWASEKWLAKQFGVDSIDD